MVETTTKNEKELRHDRKVKSRVGSLRLCGRIFQQQSSEST